MKKKQLGAVEVKTEVATTNPYIEVTLVNSIQPLGLNLDVGRQDLDDNFRKIQEKINELIRK